MGAPTFSGWLCLESGDEPLAGSLDSDFDCDRMFDCDLRGMKSASARRKAQRARNLAAIRVAYHAGDWPLVSALCASVNQAESRMRERVALARAETAHLPG